MKSLLDIVVIFLKYLGPDLEQRMNQYIQNVQAIV